MAVRFRLWLADAAKAPEFVRGLFCWRQPHAAHGQSPPASGNNDVGAGLGLRFGRKLTHKPPKPRSYAAFSHLILEWSARMRLQRLRSLQDRR